MIVVDSVKSEWLRICKQLKTGTFGLIKVMNYNELSLVFDANIAQMALFDLENAIRQIFASYDISVDTFVIDNKIFYIHKAIDAQLSQAIRFEIYQLSNLFSLQADKAFHLTCKTASTRFDLHLHQSMDEAYFILITLISDCYNGEYNIEYNPKVFSVSDMVARSQLLNDLKYSLAKKTMRFAYQPIIDSKTGQIPYYECLLRIPNFDGKIVSIGPIIEYAETIGIANVIDHQVLSMAIQELLKIHDLVLSINISNHGMIDDHLLHLAQTLLVEYDVGDRLIIEITETSLNRDYDKTKKFMHCLRHFGCKFALDDFGSGFTSFKQLQHLPIDIIKIDGSYIKDIKNNEHNKYFVKSLVQLSEELGIKTVAEFVEDGEIAKFLIDINIDAMQGNFFSPASSDHKMDSCSLKDVLKSNTNE